MTEVLEVHRGMSQDAALKAAVDLLDVVQIPEARRRVHMFRTNSPAACASA